MSGVSGRSGGASGQRGTGVRRRPTLVLLALLAATLFLVPASLAATPADTAATHALLQARYELDLAIVDSSPAAQASTAKLATSLGRECRDVLAGAPAEEGAVGPPKGAPTPRARGERKRGERQRETIDEELGAVLDTAEHQAVRAAIQSYITATAPLTWSDARIAPLVHAEAATLEESASAAPPDACADMKAWAQSGYRLLSPASRAFQSARAARAERIEPSGSLDSLLKPFEGAGERALLRRTAALGMKLKGGGVAALEQRAVVDSQLQRALGDSEGGREEQRLGPVLGHGKTRSGATFMVRAGASGEAREPSCRHEVSVELSEQRSSGHGVSFNSSVGGLCVSPIAERQQSSSGCSEDETSITVVVPGSVRSVRMRLSNGKTITSSVVRIPARYGGPGGIYVQGVRGDELYPVSLTELARDGHVVRIMRLGAARCHRDVAPTSPKFSTLVEGTAPGGQQFSIQGALVEFGHSEHSFSVSTSVGSEPSETGASNEAVIGHTGPPKAYAWSQAIGCPPRPFALLFGILAAPGDSVLVRTPEGLVPLTKQELASNLQSEGPLVYGVFNSLPSELIVRGSDGSTLYTESLAAKSAEDTEFCEGLAEG